MNERNELKASSRAEEQKHRGEVVVKKEHPFVSSTFRTSRIRTKNEKKRIKRTTK